jgi:uncharacterized protein
MDPKVLAARAAGYQSRGLAARPSERRSPVGLPKHWVPAPSSGMSLRAATVTAGMLTFEGVASVYERGYVMADVFGEYTEIVSAGAGAKSLAQVGLDVPLVLEHESIRRIASTLSASSTLQLSETAEGLHVLAQLDSNDLDVQYIKPKIDAGLITEMSFKFYIRSGQWSPDYSEFRIEEYDIQRGDVSIVGYGANPAAYGQLRSATTSTIAESLASLADHADSRVRQLAGLADDSQAIKFLARKLPDVEPVLQPKVSDATMSLLRQS